RPKRNLPAFWGNGKMSRMRCIDRVRGFASGHAHITAGDYPNSPARIDDRVVVESADATSSNGCFRLLGFRSSKTWHKVFACAFFAALYAAFVQTMFPPITSANHDILVYKVIRLLLFASPILCIVLLSDSPWHTRLPLFSSDRPSQRLLGIATLTALTLCLCANLMYLHTSEYRIALHEYATVLVAGTQEPPQDESLTTPDGEPCENVTAPGAVNDSSDGGGKSFGDAWNDQREGCGTD
ncbi:hypothetical protein, partial [Gordonibacter sp.]|uniref:hypothetical protein n=1 Tax=Gordonibacter sp. TaxID=1968902 RepID=UPI002FCC8F9A